MANGKLDAVCDAAVSALGNIRRVLDMDFKNNYLKVELVDVIKDS